jgi:hypothetical protein
MAGSWGTLLVLDETHTQFDVYGGTVTHYDVTPDMVTGGKGDRRRHPHWRLRHDQRPGRSRGAESR